MRLSALVELTRALRRRHGALDYSITVIDDGDSLEVVITCDDGLRIAINYDELGKLDKQGQMALDVLRDTDDH